MLTELRLIMVVMLICSAGAHAQRTSPDDWKITPETFDVESRKLAFQKKSLINWNKIEAETWLDFDQWKINRAIRDKDPKWKSKLREKKSGELIGKLIKCQGECQIFADSKSHYGRYLSRIYEGYEIEIGKDSHALIYLLDGSMIRLAPNTQVSFNEINLSNNKVMFYFRLSRGHIAWHGHQARSEITFNEKKETDQVLLPLMIPEANRAYYSRIEYRQGSPRFKMNSDMVSNFGAKLQYKVLNNLIKVNNRQNEFRETQLVLSIPNTTLTIKNPDFDAFHELNGQSWVKLRSQEKIKVEAVAQYRGYNNHEVENLSDELWYKIDREGKNIDEDESFTKKYSPMSLIQRRIPSLRLAREIFIIQHGDLLKEKVWTPELLANTYGYRLWGEEQKDEIFKRVSFLKEHTRRLETTNIRAVKTIYKDKKSPFGKEFYNSAMTKYMLSLKALYNNEDSMVKLMTNEEYYLWVVKNAENTIWKRKFNWYLQADLRGARN